MDSFYTYYYKGRKSDAIKFKQELIDRYSGKFPQDGYVTMDFGRDTTIIWITAFSFLIFLSIYQNMAERKTNAIRILMGDSPWRIFMISYTQDITVFSFELFVWQFVTGLYGNTFINNKMCYSLYAVFIFVDLLICVSCLNINYRKSLSDASGGWILCFSYIYKIIIISFFIVLASGCIKLIFSGIDFYKQKSFFADHRAYSYSRINLDDDDQTVYMRYKFYGQMSAKKKALTVNLVDNSSGSGESVYADTGSMQYLENIIPELKNIHPDNRVYFIIPEGENAGKVKELWEAYYRGSYDSKIIHYKPRARIIAAYKPDSMSINSLRVKHPAVILNTMQPDESTFMNPFLIDNTMYRVSRDEWKEFAEENNVDRDTSFLTNVYANYRHYWKQNKRLLIMAIGVLVLLVILESIINSTVVHYEYQTNAMELVIKKFLGYSFLQRYRSIFLSAATGDIIGIVIAVILLHNSGLLEFVFAGAVIICLLDMTVLVSKTRNMESQQINKILKGGFL